MNTTWVHMYSQMWIRISFSDISLRPNLIIPLESVKISCCNRNYVLSVHEKACMIRCDASMDAKVDALVHTYGLFK